MRGYKSLLGSLSLLACQIHYVRSHAAIVNVTGDNGIVGSAFGVVSSTPRDGTDEQPFQIDTSVFKNLVSDPCGSTLAGGSVNIASSLAAAEKAGKGKLPALTKNLVVSMTLHQINGDGGGPFTAMFNTDGTGRKWQNAKVITQAPGENGLLAGGPFDSLFEAQLPAGTVCTGGTSKNACLVRVSNGGAAVGAGPFGGCIAVQMPSGATGRNSTAGGNKNKGGQNKMQRSVEFNVLKRQIARILRRLSISPSEANDLITASGSALNIPIDLLAGQDDASPNGGNSTTAKGALLTVKQAEDLKVAVKDAVSKAIEMMATGKVTPTSGAVATQINSQNPDLAITRNQEMSASFSSSLATFISKPVGQPAGTAVLTTPAAATGTTTTRSAVTPTATSARGNGKNHNGANRNGQNNNQNGAKTGAGNNQNANAGNGAHKHGQAPGAQAATDNQARTVRLPRVHSRIMRDLAPEDLV